MRRFSQLMVLMIVGCFISDGFAKAGFDEGLAAYEHGDYARALKEFLPLAQSGDAEAQYNVALIYQHGLGVPRNFQAALKMYIGAANNGIAEAQLALGDFIVEGVWGRPDFAKAAKWYRMAAEQGDATAQRKLGRLYLEGKGVKKDQAAAARLLKNAARQGDAEAGVLLNGLPADTAARRRASFAGRSLATSGQCKTVDTFGADSYDVNVDFVYPEPRLVHTRSISDLNRMAKAGREKRVLGLRKTGLDIKTLPKAALVKNGKTYCFWVTGFDVAVRYKGTEVLVAREYPEGSCQYKAVLAHEY